jgi:hypothetical protein
MSSRTVLRRTARERPDWKSLVDALFATDHISDAVALEQLRRLNFTEHRDGDMVVLVASLMQCPGIKARILECSQKGRPRGVVDRE